MKYLSKVLKNQRGVVPPLILIAIVGLLGFLLVANLGDFRNKLFSSLFPKPSSQAQVGMETAEGVLRVLHSDDFESAGNDMVNNFSCITFGYCLWFNHGKGSVSAHFYQVYLQT